MWSEKSESVEARKSAKSVFIFLTEFATRLGIEELFTNIDRRGIPHFSQLV